MQSHSLGGQFKSWDGLTSRKIAIDQVVFSTLDLIFQILKAPKWIWNLGNFIIITLVTEKLLRKPVFVKIYGKEVVDSMNILKR